MHTDRRSQADRAIRQAMGTDRDLALAQAREWLREDPHSLQARAMHAWTLAAVMDFEGAAREYAICAETSDASHIHAGLADALHQLGRYGEALEHRLKAIASPEPSSADVCRAGLAAHIVGDRALARRIHDEHPRYATLPHIAFGRMLLDAGSRQAWKETGKRLAANPTAVDHLVQFWRGLDAHVWGEADHKGRWAALVDRTCASRPLWWPRTWRLPEAAVLATEHIAREAGTRWIFKRSNLMAGQHTRVGPSPLSGWLGAGDLASDAVLQEYVEEPLLVEGRKFNIRLQLCLNAPFVEAAHLWRDGLVFIATRPHDTATHEAQVVNPRTADPALLQQAIGPFAAPGVALSRFLEVNFKPSDAAGVRESLQRVAADVVGIFERGGLLRAVREIPNWRAFPPKFLGIDLTLDRDLAPHVFEIERYTGMGTGSPATAAVLTKFRHEWFEFITGESATHPAFVTLAPD